MKGSGIIGDMITSRTMRLNRVVVVNGFGDSQICDSQVQRHDTRIFMVNRDGSELKLNSSIVKVTLNNLDHVDAIVKGQSVVSHQNMLLVHVWVTYLHFLDFFFLIFPGLHTTLTFARCSPG